MNWLTLEKAVQNLPICTSNTYWSLTAYGDSVMARLLAIRRAAPPNKAMQTDAASPRR
jgi:hypothetical protein